MTVQVGRVTLSSPVMPSSGTFGYGVEFARYGDLSALGAVVVKSLSPEPWLGNAAPRVVETSGAMINAVGLQNPGIDTFCRDYLPKLHKLGAKVVVSIWGRTVADFGECAQRLTTHLAQHPELDQSVIAIEACISCPNLEDRSQMFAHSTASTTAAISAIVAVTDKPVWAKLSPNTNILGDIAEAALTAGADALTLTNTLLGIAFDPETNKPALGNGGGGVSGPALHPIALRAVYDLRNRFMDAPIVGVGGVLTGLDAQEFLVAGANAVQVGTASFVDPRAVWVIAEELAEIQQTQPTNTPTSVTANV